LKYFERASVARFVTVCGAAGFIAMVITPQLVVITIVLANFLSTVVGCFKVAGTRAFAVGFVQPLTEVGRSAAGAAIGVNEATVIARAQSAEILFIVEFLLPLNSFASVHFIPTRSFLAAC
jgi:hypothetical protein